MRLTKAQVLGLVLALVAAGLVLWLWPQEEPDVRTAITRRVVKLTADAERKDLAELMDGVSERFRSAEGWGKQELKGVLLGQVLRGQWVRIFTTGLDITPVSQTRGDFQIKLIFGRSEADALEKLARDSVLSAYLIQGTFEREEDGEWRVVQASHRPLNPSDLF
jgi:hypothetical protein